eukprot:TRINITY_DN17_c1_g1_i10.p1 TRINITY_DN17_c1_g1~~TRINITY_DN17_c1_g1_i10.p1  ORF type:complete len:586 (+),score=148.25 TRINITY_DN17_c1_g1_i10:458-2215(+)
MFWAQQVPRTPPQVEMDAVPHHVLAATFFVGKAVSWFVYNSCWWFSHPIGNMTPYGGKTDGSLVLAYMQKWWAWAFVMAACGLRGWGTDTDEQLLRVLVTMQCAVLAWKGVFRFGAVDQLRFHMADRLIVCLLAPLVYCHPVFVCPSLLASCVLTYSISSWPIAPPYSNYLGNEFMRYATSFSLVSLVLQRTLWSGVPSATVAIVIIVASQVEYYFHQGFGKVRLGERPWDWLLLNRGECILVNSYLRGWHRYLSKEAVLWAASNLKRVRFLLGAGALAAEMGGLVSASIPWYLLAACFHIMVFLMTGILVWENVVSHLVMCYVMYANGMLGFTCLNLTLVCCVLVSEAMVVGLEKLLHRDKVKALMLFDSAYLLMCWWDSPYMRMYTYEVTTDQGVFAFPVTMFAPYDTFITDIHTRMSYFKMHTGFDRQRSDDLNTVHSGVWGLLLYKHEAMKMYNMMDGGESKAPLTLTDDMNKWAIDKTDKEHPAYPFLRFMAGFNAHLPKQWFRAVMRWPHFPGEDMVPDVQPLTSLPLYTTSNGSIKTLTIKLVKTFYTGADIEMLDTTTIGTIDVPPLSDITSDNLTT